MVDGIPFEMPVTAHRPSALLALFTINAEKAKGLMPGNEVHPYRLWNKGLLAISAIHYQSSVIGSYIEFSVGIACTRGKGPAPRLLPALFRKHYGMGLLVHDLPVNTEISVKGGKGIWGMPKHLANLDLTVSADTVSGRYDKDGQLVMKVEVTRPRQTWFPARVAVANYSQFRGMLTMSHLYFSGKMGFGLFKKGSAKLTLGDHPLALPIKDLQVSQNPIFTAFVPEAHGVLDDNFQSWFLSYEGPPDGPSEGLDSVANLTNSQEWQAPPELRNAD